MGFAHPHREGLIEKEQSDLGLKGRDSPGFVSGLLSRDGNTVQVSSSHWHKRLAQKWLCEHQAALERWQEGDTERNAGFVFTNKLWVCW